MGRSEIREHIFRMLFGREFHTQEELLEQGRLYMELLKTEREVSETDEAYIQEKCRKVEELIPEIDALINEQTTGWKTGRMNKADLTILRLFRFEMEGGGEFDTILRLAVYEMKWDEDIPVKVAINEAVELAKKYSSDEGPSFINGVLAKIAA